MFLQEKQLYFITNNINENPQQKNEVKTMKIEQNTIIFKSK